MLRVSGSARLSPGTLKDSPFSLGSGHALLASDLPLSSPPTRPWDHSGEQRVKQCSFQPQLMCRKEAVKAGAEGAQDSGGTGPDTLHPTCKTGDDRRNLSCSRAWCNKPKMKDGLL